MSSEELLRKFGAQEAVILQERAAKGEIEAQLILEAAYMQAQDGCPDLARLAAAFDCKAHLVRRVIQEFNRQSAQSFRLPRRATGIWRLSPSHEDATSTQRHFEP